MDFDVVRKIVCVRVHLGGRNLIVFFCHSVSWRVIGGVWRLQTNHDYSCKMKNDPFFIIKVKTLKIHSFLFGFFSSTKVYHTANENSLNCKEKSKKKENQFRIGKSNKKKEISKKMHVELPASIVPWLWAVEQLGYSTPATFPTAWAANALTTVSYNWNETKRRRFNEVDDLKRCNWSKWHNG